MSLFGKSVFKEMYPKKLGMYVSLLLTLPSNDNSLQSALFFSDILKGRCTAECKDVSLFGKAVGNNIYTHQVFVGYFRNYFIFFSVKVMSIKWHFNTKTTYVLGRPSKLGLVWFGSLMATDHGNTTRYKGKYYDFFQ